MSKLYGWRPTASEIAALAVASAGTSLGGALLRACIGRVPAAPDDYNFRHAFEKGSEGAQAASSFCSRMLRSALWRRCPLEAGHTLVLGGVLETDTGWERLAREVTFVRAEARGPTPTDDWWHLRVVVRGADGEEGYWSRTGNRDTGGISEEQQEKMPYETLDADDAARAIEWAKRHAVWDARMEHA